MASRDPHPDDSRLGAARSTLSRMFELARSRRTPGGRGSGPTMTVFEMLAIGVVGLFLAVLFNASALHRDAEHLPFGPHRDRSLAVWGPIDAVASTLQLTRVRSEIDAAANRDGNAADGDPFAATSDATVSGAGGDPEAPATTTTAVPVLRVPSASEPLVTYVAGDSMVREFGNAFVRDSEATGAFVATLDARVSTGLSRPDYYDWPGRLGDQIDDLDPDVIILMFGANDAQGLETPDGTVIALENTAGWDAEYRRRVAATMNLAAGADRHVYWLGQPPMREPTFAASMRRLNAIYESEAAAHDRVTFVDATPLLGDADGAYQDIVELDGEVVDLRQQDGIHLNLDGADRYAAAVLALIEADAAG